jgi:5-dehydro-2-deoxygluconokinase
MTQPVYDLLTIGRSSIDLYSNDSGASFSDISSFGAFVGGCPTNIAVGTRRLGLKTALLTAVGNDPVGDFVLNFLKREGVETRFIPKKVGKRTSAVILGIEPPDKFPLVFYRDNCADVEITIDDALQVPLQNTRALLVSGTGLSKEPSRSTTLLAVEKAREAGAIIFLDLDFRADQWHDPRAFGVTMRMLLPSVDIVFGTEEEILAAILEDASQLQLVDHQISAPQITGNIQTAIETLLSKGPQALVQKRGAKGAIVHLPGQGAIEAMPFKVDVCNVLGAGDAFASGFIFGHLQGWDWKKCLRMGNATGAIVVTRQGCANFMPYQDEALQFIEEQGGFEPTTKSDQEKEALCLS